MKKMISVKRSNISNLMSALIRTYNTIKENEGKTKTELMNMISPTKYGVYKSIKPILASLQKLNLIEIRRINGTDRYYKINSKKTTIQEILSLLQKLNSVSPEKYHLEIYDDNSYKIVLGDTDGIAVNNFEELIQKIEELKEAYNK